EKRGGQCGGSVGAIPAGGRGAVGMGPERTIIDRLGPDDVATAAVQRQDEHAPGWAPRRKRRERTAHLGVAKLPPTLAQQALLHGLARGATRPIGRARRPE